MTLNYRCIEIMNILYNEAKTLRELCEIFQVTSRSIRYDIDNINYILKNLKYNQIEMDKNKKIFLDIEKDILEKIISDFSEISPQERREYLLFKILVENKLCLTEEAEILDISRSILKIDLNRVSTEMSLSIKYIQGKGTFLVDDENKIRETLNNILLKYMERIDFLKDPLKKLVLKKIEECNLSGIKDKIDEMSGSRKNTKKLLAIFMGAILREKYMKDTDFESLRKKQTFKIETRKIFVTDYETEKIYHILENKEIREEKIEQLLLNIKKELNLKEDFSEEVKIRLKKIYYKNKNSNFFKIIENEKLEKGEYLLGGVFTLIRKELPELYRDYSLLIAMKIREFIITKELIHIKDKRAILVSSVEENRLENIVLNIKRILNIDVLEVITPFMFKFLKDKKKESKIIFTTEELKIDKQNQDREIIHLDIETISDYFIMKIEDLKKIAT